MSNQNQAIPDYSEADTRAKLIDPALYARGWKEYNISREVNAGGIYKVRGRWKREQKFADYLLRIQVAGHAEPVAVALIEAKKNTLPPHHGLEQAKQYADAERLNVPFVFTSNGYRYVEYNHSTGDTTPPKLMSEFPTPTELRQRYELHKGFTLEDEAAKPLLMPYTGGDSVRRYYQDAAIRAVLEKIAAGEKRMLLSLTNPPFGGKEGKEAQTHFAYKTSSTQVLFLQHVIDSLRPNGGKCAIVVDEGILFRNNESAYVKTKQKLLDECNLWCIVSLPGGVFTQAGAGVKTNILFFTKGAATEKIWYYDLSQLKIRKRTPLTLADFDHFFSLLPQRADSDYSWAVHLVQRKAQAASEAEPFRRQAQALLPDLRKLEGRAQALKEAKLTHLDEYGALQEQMATLTKTMRDLRNRAQAIEDAVYDLKAVNPHAQVQEDALTPDELLDIIETKGHEVAKALAALRLPTA